MLAARKSMLERPMTAHRSARLVTVAAILVPLAGCAYLTDRGRDFTDIVDVKGGAGGLGDRSPAESVCSSRFALNAS